MWSSECPACCRHCRTLLVLRSLLPLLPLLPAAGADGTATPAAATASAQPYDGVQGTKHATTASKLRHSTDLQVHQRLLRPPLPSKVCPRGAR